MHKGILFLLLVALACKDQPQPIADARMNDYALYDEQGNFHRLSYYNNSRGIVLWVQGNGCPIVRAGLEDFKKIADEFSKKGFVFFMINPNLQDTRESIRKEAETYRFQVPVLDDHVQLVTNMLDINITAEVFVLHPTTREVLYRGPINNKFDYEIQKNEASQEYLKDALQALLNQRPVLSRKGEARGCKVTRIASLGDHLPTYTQDIGPILGKHCAICHHEEGIGPWNMDKYQTVVGWSSMIKQVLLTKRMPPWKADPSIGHFKNSLVLPDSSARKIISWIDQGMPYGEGADPLAQWHFDDTIWKSPPDKILTLDTEEIPANGIIPYRYQKIHVNLEKDTWIKGVEIKPSNPKVVHHILITTQSIKKQSPIVNRPPRKWIDNFIALGGMGDPLTQFPEGSGIFLPKDSELIVQIHYTPTGKPEKDNTQIGLHFLNEKPERELLSLATANVAFEIPPFGKEVKIIAEDAIKENIWLHFVVPHMHYRGKSIRFIVEYPDGKEEIVVSVADYNFNWQRLYQLQQPLAVPKGSKIRVEGIFDNTYQNPYNPDPSQKLTFGLQSTDEMLIGFFNYTLQ